MATYKWFIKQIYWNFMESGISGIRIWFNLCVSVSNKLGKPYMGFNAFLTIDNLSFRLFGLELSTRSQTSEISFLTWLIFSLLLQGK